MNFLPLLDSAHLSYPLGVGIKKNLLSGSGKNKAGLSEESLCRQQKPLQMTEIFLRRNILKEKNKRKSIPVEAWSDDIQVLSNILMTFLPPADQAATFYNLLLGCCSSLPSQTEITLSSENFSSAIIIHAYFFHVTAVKQLLSYSSIFLFWSEQLML